MYAYFQKQDAIQALIKGGHHIKASQLHIEYEEYSKAIEVLLKAKLYPEAAATAKVLEDGDKCPSEFSSLGIAKKNILKYCMAPEHIKETEDRIFNGLLKYITSKELQIAYLKHAKRFNEVLKIYFQAHDYEKFYRIAFAQGPNTISPKKSALDVTTYYDSALRLSLALGHNAMNAAFVINHSRSYLHHHEPEGSYDVFSITQLEHLSCTPNRDINVQVNAHLLLAKYDPSRIESAIQICQKHNCLPGEIELIFLSHSRKLQLPSCYSSISYQLEIVHKICFLLSLNKQHLINAYKGILGVHEGKVDKLYDEQAEFTEDLQLTNFITDCYLLPHKHQDIWLKTLTREKEISRDIDGMYVIPQDILYRQIKHHLKQALNKALSRIISKSPLYSRQLELCEYSSIKFDTEYVSSCLDCCELALLHGAKNYDHMTVKILREYHSIGNVYCLPLCENYSSFIDSIKRNRRVWNSFQSQTNQWIAEILSSECFDSIKLWEQSSVAMVTESLRKDLVQYESKSDCSDIFRSCSRATIKWFDASKYILDDPFQSCELYFTECLPELLKIGQNLHSIINSMTVYGSVALALVRSCTASTLPIVIPEVYIRALSVYDSLLLRSHNETILSACYAVNAKHNNSDLLSVLLQVIEDALKNVIALLRKESIYECEALPRQCLILVLTLLTNFIMLQPRPSSISQICSKLNKCIDLKIKLCEKFELNYQAVGTAIKHAKSTSDFVKVIQYLFSNSGTTCSEFGRYEALALLVVSDQRRSIGVTVLNDREVEALPLTVLQAAKEKINQELEVLPLLSAAKRKRDLYFKVHPFRGTYSLTKVNIKPPWLCLQTHNRRGTQQPAEFLDFVDLGFSQDLQSSAAVAKSESICHVCTVEKEENHVQSDTHKRNLALYKQFLALHDHDYVQCEAKFRKANKHTTPRVEALLSSISNMITAVYKGGDWMKGIELIQAYCIPKVKDMTVGLNSKQ